MKILSVFLQPLEDDIFFMNIWYLMPALFPVITSVYYDPNPH